METHTRTHVDEHALWLPVTEQDRERVLQQMERLLETSHFRNSRRYPALLRFIVEETLAGRGEFLKERLLGVQVFGRPSDYDTAADPVVRVTVAEIRKRIAQYYYDEGHAHELRIELLPGRYEPEFRLSRDATQQAAGVSDPLPHAGEQAPPPWKLKSTQAGSATPMPAASPAASAGRRRLFLLAVCGVLALTFAGLGFAGWKSLHPSALDRFWQPVLGAHRPILLCLPVSGGKYGVAATSRILLPSQQNSKPGLSPSSYLALESLGENVVFSDVRAMMTLSDLISQHNGEQRLRLNTAVSLDDLRQGPAILIGAMDNPWTLRAISHLRYQFGGDDEENYWIIDTRTGKRTGWSLDLKTPITSVTRDYAILARIHSEETGQPQVIVGGIGMSGTAAAGELLTNAAQMEALMQRVAGGFDKRDFEAVISTDVVNGIAGEPKILVVEIQ